ncbi:MAG: selenide, water dikinase SelD [Nitrospinae bacterium]|nr:selenide, water dikinase SelD [Nitrospinota bacterium]
MGPCDLKKTLDAFKAHCGENVLVGLSALDDAGVVKLSDDLAIVQTADFITPVVDDPFQFGRIAAANSLSDIYAMGGKPLSALNLVCWPSKLSGEILREVLQGGEDAAQEAGCTIIGGHTIEDDEPKYGMAVNGTVHPGRILRNIGALPGDALYLTKPLGIGVLSTALKFGKTTPEESKTLVETMSALNKDGSEAALAAGARAMTDITGFGLAGHLLEMLGTGSYLGIEISAKALPLLPGLMKHLGGGTIPGGVERNFMVVEEKLRIDKEVDPAYKCIICDPQTSGGLAIAVPPEKEDAFAKEASMRGVKAVKAGFFNDTGVILLR